MKSFVIYKGPSVLDGKPIICIATIGSKNAKTGNMVQTWIMREDIHPVEAAKALEDSSVCGGCPLRTGLGGACYVALFQAPAQIWKTYQKGKYAEPTKEEIAQAMDKKAIRLGAYGDPAAVPFEVWENALSNARANTGYTHQLNHKNFDARILKYCMVSAETAKQAQKYHSKNLRTFRVITPNAPLFANEIVCPSESEGMTCLECKKCNSATDGNNPSIVIEVHGGRFKKHAAKYDKANLIAVG